MIESVVSKNLAPLIRPAYMGLSANSDSAYASIASLMSECEKEVASSLTAVGIVPVGVE
jgi:hypothetical protein